MSPVVLADLLIPHPDNQHRELHSNYLHWSKQTRLQQCRIEATMESKGGQLLLSESRIQRIVC